MFLHIGYGNPPAQKIHEVFPFAILDVVQEMNVPIILHLPKVITQSVAELETLLQMFPRLVVVLAHLGLPHLPVPGLTSAHETISQYPNVYMDTSMIPSFEVHFMALQTFGSSRIMFGSNEPLSLIRSRPYLNPEKGQRIITEFPYHWVDQDEHDKYKHLA